MIFSKNTLTNILIPVLLAIISGCIIFYKFPYIPQHISTDEVEFIQLAQSLENIPYTPYSQLATGHATLYFYILLASIKLFGSTVFAVRFPSAFFGVIDVVLIYFVFKLIFERLDKLNSMLQIGLPVLMAFIFATMRWYFNFARFGFEASTVLFFELAGLLTFLQYLKYKNYGFLIGTGILAGLAYNSYTPGRLFFLLPIILLCFHFWENKTTKKKLVKQLLYVLVPFVICITPLNLYFTQHDDNRIYEQFFLQSERISIQEKSSFLWENITKVSGMFLFQGDSNGRHNYPGKPMLNPFLGILFLVGLIISIFQWKKFPNKIFLLYFALGILPPLLTYPWENPNALRSVTVLPAVVFFIGQSLQLITKISMYKKHVIYILFILVGLSAIYEIRTYFVFQTLVFPSSFEISPDLLPQYLDGTYPIRPNSIQKL
ncbi:MAG: glycosyltransferase family 39 protein [Candidatus Roizmanbacteria bacterium]|nr:glycosyltransferase family 39 protein [Candidatus Roizmanbacteria bacterium]